MTRSAFTIVLAILLLACAPGLGNRIQVPALPEPASDGITKITGMPLKVTIGRFMDTRTNDALAQINGREVKADGDVGQVVATGFEEYLRQAGADIKVIGAPSVAGEVTDWKVHVLPGFPYSEITATARIKVEVSSQDGHVVYKAVYAGESSLKHPAAGEDTVKKILADAMGHAVLEAVNDSEFLTQIARNG